MTPCTKLFVVGPGGSPGESEVHISYHNGDHYNSVRRIGDTGNTPSKIRLCSVNNRTANCDNYRDTSEDGNDDLSADSGQESEYENSPSNSKLNKLGMSAQISSKFGNAKFYYF